MHRFALCSCLLVLCTARVEAYSSYGLGQIKCASYLERRGHDQEQQSVDNTAFIHAYLSGYLTAGNTLHGLVGEHSKDVSIDIHRMVQWLDAWCGKHPAPLVAVALESFWVEAAAARELLEKRRKTGEGPR